MHVIYAKESTRFVRIIRDGYWQDAEYVTLTAAKAGFTRLKKEGKVSELTHEIAEKSHFHACIEKQETKKNLLSGEEFTQPVNTPLCCDPSSETYHCM